MEIVKVLAIVAGGLVIAKLINSMLKPEVTLTEFTIIQKDGEVYLLCPRCLEEIKLPKYYNLLWRIHMVGTKHIDANHKRKWWEWRRK